MTDVAFKSHITVGISKSAQVQADRAARKIIAQARKHGWAVVENDDKSEYLLEATYEEAMVRNVYQSEASYEQWLDWRTIVERQVLAAFGHEVEPVTKVHIPSY